MEQKSVTLAQLLPLILDAFANGQTAVLPVTGVSMRPTLLPGDSVTLAAADPAAIRRGDVVLYRRDSHAFVLHRVVKAHKDTLTLCGDGQVALEKGLPRTAVIGKAIAGTHSGTPFGEDYLRRTARTRLFSRPFRAAATAIHRMKQQKLS
ncbi:MAG: S24/S26 family peptidase [Clostridia bacterium]|nr:S24/S26 family peptidase [Clostridia bacterium]